MEPIRNRYRISLGPSSHHTIGSKRPVQYFPDRHPSKIYPGTTLYGSRPATGKCLLADQPALETARMAIQRRSTYLEMAQGRHGVLRRGGRGVDPGDKGFTGGGIGGVDPARMACSLSAKCIGRVACWQAISTAQRDRRCCDELNENFECFSALNRGRDRRRRPYPAFFYRVLRAYKTSNIN